MRFLPQEAYEQAAPLEVLPRPDVVTRIFMLFKGIGTEDVGEWDASQKRAEEDVHRWIDVVGVDVQRTIDTQLFRVIEWGGMELS